MSQQRRGNYISQAWLVILLGLVYGGALAGVQTALSEKIEANKKAETYRVIPDLIAGADSAKTEEIIVSGVSGKESRTYKVFSADGSHIGWVLPAGGSGFADRIDLIVGLDSNVSTITGMYVLDQKETPGLGDYITSEDFQTRFRKKPASEPLLVVKGTPQANNEVQALTGATISSESVVGIVNHGVAEYGEALRAQSEAGRQGLVEPIE